MERFTKELLSGLLVLFYEKICHGIFLVSNFMTIQTALTGPFVVASICVTYEVKVAQMFKKIYNNFGYIIGFLPQRKDTSWNKFRRN